ncbi:MAG: Holliday junction resolvase RuvX [Chloroflexi bacterium]|nr:MAG: Holliday junction resolvase RuvX [Chloroflexota bacterium]
MSGLPGPARAQRSAAADRERHPGHLPVAQCEQRREPHVRRQCHRIHRVEARHRQGARSNRRPAGAGREALSAIPGRQVGGDQRVADDVAIDAGALEPHCDSLRGRVERTTTIDHRITEPSADSVSLALRILAVDPGSKRVGLALSDPTETIAQPLATVPAEPLNSLAARLAEVARSNEAARVIVGLPLRLDGSHGPEAAAARRLASQIEHESGLPVDLVDERLTSAAAERALIAGGVSREERRAGVDRVAATMLLQSHLEWRRRQKPG